MSYAVVEDVQALIPTQIVTLDLTSPVTEGQVESWLSELSRWIDATLRWKYAVPVTDAGDLEMLRPICAMLAAGRVWTMLGGHAPDLRENGAQLRREALSMLAYDQRAGRSMLVLPSTSESESGEAAQFEAEATFTDPDSTSEDVNPRLFRMDMNF